MRIIAGKYKGRRIELPKDSSGIRPTSEFARQAIFNILTHGKHGLNGHTFEDKRVLDLFCGTGAFGLEALSRGAAHATFIDQSREALAAAHHNAEKMQALGESDFQLANAAELPPTRKPYDLVFLDPPYFAKLLGRSLTSLKNGGWIDADSTLVIEHDAKEAVELPEGFARVDERRYGRAVIALLKLIP